RYATLFRYDNADLSENAVRTDDRRRNHVRISLEGDQGRTGMVFSQPAGAGSGPLGKDGEHLPLLQDLHRPFEGFPIAPSPTNRKGTQMSDDRRKDRDAEQFFLGHEVNLAVNGRYHQGGIQVVYVIGAEHHRPPVRNVLLSLHFPPVADGKKDAEQYPAQPI